MADIRMVDIMFKLKIDPNLVQGYTRKYTYNL